MTRKYVARVALRKFRGGTLDDGSMRRLSARRYKLSTDLARASIDYAYYSKRLICFSFRITNILLFGKEGYFEVRIAEKDVFQALDVDIEVFRCLKDV